LLTQQTPRGRQARMLAMRRQLVVGSLALGIVVAVSGCGGSSTYSLSRTETCLKGKGYQAVALANQLLPGAGGNLRLALGPNFGDEYVFMVFAGNHGDALATENKAVDLALKAFQKRNLIYTRAEILAGVVISRNVFYYSDTQPIAQDVRDAVQPCLR
jgi:hypothetical protein